MTVHNFHHNCNENSSPPSSSPTLFLPTISIRLLFIQRFPYNDFDILVITDSLQGCADPQVRDFVQFEDVSRNDTSRTIHLYCEEHHSSLGEHHSTCTYDVITGETTWLPNPSEFICFGNYPTLL